MGDQIDPSKQDYDEEVDKEYDEFGVDQFAIPPHGDGSDGKLTKSTP